MPPLSSGHYAKKHGKGKYIGSTSHEPANSYAKSHPNGRSWLTTALSRRTVLLASVQLRHASTGQKQHNPLLRISTKDRQLKLKSVWWGGLWSVEGKSGAEIECLGVFY